jgi:Cu+-exporting ATPase
MESETIPLFYFAHRLKRQIRIIVPCLYEDRQRAHILQTLLLKREEINSVDIVIEVNSVTINFDYDRLPLKELERWLGFILKNFTKKPVNRHKKHVLADGETQKKLTFLVEGMKCASCALFIEMFLTQEFEDIDVKIDYATHIGIANGRVDKVKVFDLIEKNGFQVRQILTMECYD